MKTLRNQEGFTLVELMVVVAIIGILSAVAIPNFKKYQAKSKTSEAKLQLASIYSAETALQSDFDSFGTCLEDAGYVAPTQGNYYALGFQADVAAANGNITTNGGTCANSQYVHEANKQVAGNTATETEIDAMSGLDGATLFGAGNLAVPSVKAEGDEFTAAASGYISSDSATADEWAINENKQLIHVDVGY
jgi:type IV pilus assembly protein PilA